MRVAYRQEKRSPPVGADGGFLIHIWHVIRLPIFAFLVLMEPIVRVVFVTLGTLTVLMAFFFKYLTPLKHFPFWGMLSFGVGCALLVMFYHAVMRFFRGSV